MGLLAIGLAVLTLTPGRLDAPVRLASPATLDDLAASVTPLTALRSSTPPAPAPAPAPASTQPRAALGPETAAAAFDEIRPPMARTTFTTIAQAVPATAASTTSPLPAGRAADPIGSSGYALLAVDPGAEERPERHSPVDVHLPTGDVRTALAVASTDVVTLVAIDPAAGSRLATSVPKAADTVTVTSDDDTTRITYAELLADLEPPAEAVITDETGAVVGVCADHGGKLVYQPLVSAPADVPAGGRP